MLLAKNTTTVQKYVKIIEDIMVPPFFLHIFLPMLELMIAFPCLSPLLGVLVSNSYWVCPFHLILRRERTLVKKTASEPLGHPCLCPPYHHSRVSHFLLWGSAPTSLESSVCLFVCPPPNPRVCVCVCGHAWMYQRDKKMTLVLGPCLRPCLAHIFLLTVTMYTS